MFKNFTNFAYKRTPKQALGFYLANVAFAFVLIFLLGIPFALIYGIGNSFREGFNSSYAMSRSLAPVFWPIYSTIYSLVLSFLILKAKHLFKSGDAVLWAMTSVVLSGIGTVMLGLIVIAILSTKESRLADQTERLPSN